MGHRINKEIGYGFSDLKPPKKRGFADPRISDVFKKKYNDLDSIDIDTFIDFHKETHEDRSIVNLDAMVLRERRDRNTYYRIEPYDYISFNHEYGDPKTLLFKDLSSDWSRSDNIIDYLEADGNIKSVVKKLPYGIYPYIDKIDIRTGNREYTRLDGTKQRFASFDKVIEKTRNNGIPLKNIDFSTVNCKNIKEYQQYIKNEIPPFIKSICLYYQVFNDTSVIDTMDPLYYIHWT